MKKSIQIYEDSYDCFGEKKTNFLLIESIQINGNIVKYFSNVNSNHLKFLIELNIDRS